LTARPPKCKHATSTPEHPEKCKELAKRKHATSTPEQPEKRRKSIQLAQVQGRLEKLQENSSRPIEIEDEQPSRPKEETKKSSREEKEEAEQSKEETEQSEEEN